MRSDRIESVGGGVRGGSGRGRLGVSTRSGELDSATKRSVNKQNKAAESYKIKDMDKLEKGQRYRADLKLRKEADRLLQLKNAETKGKIKGAAATAGVGIGALAIVENKKKKAQGTQSGHTVTSVNRKTGQSN